MMFCVDAAYEGDRAAVCATGFRYARSRAPARILTAFVKGVDDYVPGSFFRRELPCLMKVIGNIQDEINLLIIDGYVWLPGNMPGLGARLYLALNSRVPVIGIAKSPFRGSRGVLKVLRGESIRPLYVTSIGIQLREASELVRNMAGGFRIPDMMRIADSTAKVCLWQKVSKEGQTRP